MDQYLTSMKLWSISSVHSTEVVLGDTLLEAVNFYQRELADIDNPKATEPMEVRYIGDLMIPNGVDLRSIFYPPKQSGPVPLPFYQAVQTAILKRGKSVGYARDLIDYLPTTPPNLSRDGLAKIIGHALGKLQMPFKKGSSPRLYQFERLLADSPFHSKS